MVEKRGRRFGRRLRRTLRHQHCNVLCGTAAPERGSYSRIGACPYLSSQLIDSRCCPCKGRISWAGLAPQQDSRYEPLTGARFINRIQKVGASPYPGICAPFRGAGAALFAICFGQVCDIPLQGRWRRIVRNMVQANLRHPTSGALAPHCPKYGSGRGAGAALFYCGGINSIHIFHLYQYCIDGIAVETHL